MVILDGSGNGELHADDFKEALENLGIHLKPHQAEAVVQLYDTDGDGFVSTEEFMDAASIYKDDNGYVDFFAFANGIVKELEEEFGPIDASDSNSSTSEDDEYDFSDVDSVTDENGRHTPSHRRRSTTRRRGLSIETPPIPTEDVGKLEDLISKRMKIQHYEKTGQELTWEDYEGTGIPRPKHIVHNFAGMSKRARAHYAYKHTPTKRSPRRSPGNSPVKFSPSPRSPPRNILTPAVRSPRSPGVASIGSSVTAFSDLSPKRSSPNDKGIISPSASVPTGPKMGGYFDPETKRYVSKAMHEQEYMENSDVSALFDGAHVNIRSEAEELFYKYTPPIRAIKPGRRVRMRTSSAPQSSTLATSSTAWLLPLLTTAWLWTSSWTYRPREASGISTPPFASSSNYS
jgi:hypothetical protein